MINKTTIAQMKKGSFLINSSRGTVVDIEAVVDALDSEHLNGAAFDVFPKEPKSKDEEFSSTLRGQANIILTPHIAGSTEESQAGLGAEVSDKMVDCLLNGNFNSALNKLENPRCKADE
jgi:D-3-phosphoglycerate dehydrogenase